MIQWRFLPTRGCWKRWSCSRFHCSFEILGFDHSILRNIWHFRVIFLGKGRNFRSSFESQNLWQHLDPSQATCHPMCLLSNRVSPFPSYRYISTAPPGHHLPRQLFTHRSSQTCIQGSDSRGLFLSSYSTWTSDLLKCFEFLEKLVPNHPKTDLLLFYYR